MAIRARSSTWQSVTLLVLVLAGWGFDQWRKSHPPAPSAASVPPIGGKGQPAGDKEGNYEVYRNCTLSVEKHNDGDSFEVRLPDGRTKIFRLYFVDTPESDFKTYGGGQSNYERIGQQAAALGGITPQQAVEIGHQAKEYTLALLAKRPFTIYTRWDSPFNDQRYHAFVQVEDGGKPCWLDGLLVGRGFCRIFTRGADMPDGTSLSRRKDQLHAIERDAKARRAGAWGLR